MRTNLTHCILAGLGLALASQAQAATVTGNITSTLTLISACQVNGSAGTSGVNFGNLNFGTQDALFGTANAQVMGPGGGAMSILCSNGTGASIRVRAGAHDGLSTGGTRALADGNGNFVPYDFYTDAGHTVPLAIDGTLQSLDNSLAHLSPEIDPVSGGLHLVEDDDPFDIRRGAEERSRRAAAGDGDPGARNLPRDLADHAGGYDAVADPVGADEQNLRGFSGFGHAFRLRFLVCRQLTGPDDLRERSR